MKNLFSKFRLCRLKKSASTTSHPNRSHLHDNNEDILRIIRLYNQGTMKTVNDNEALKSNIKYPFLLKQRVSNFYLFLTAALSIISSIYMNCSISSIMPYIIKNQIRSVDSNNQDQVSSIDEDIIRYVSFCFYFSGLLGGSLLFGWLGCQVRQRKRLLMMGTSSSFLSNVAILVSIEYWMLFPATFLQGISNACVWILSTAIIADVWPLIKWGTMIGFIGGLFSLGTTVGIIGVGAVSNYSDYHISLYCSLTLCAITFFMQVLVIERSTIPEDWLEPKLIKDETENMKVKEEEDFTKMIQHENLDVIEGGSWSKSSSLSTINLRDQPIIFEKDKNLGNSKNTTKDSIYNSLLFRIISSIPIIALLYQLLVISSILGTLKSTLIENLKSQMDIENTTYQDIIISTFLFPFSVSAFMNGWLCDLFGSKIVGLTTVIISIPAIIWIGVPHQNIESIVSALTLSGITLGGMTVATLISTVKAIQKVQLQKNIEMTKQEMLLLQRQQSTTIFAFICTLLGIGFFSSYFFAKLNGYIGFLWLCFTFSMLLATCIPLIAYFQKTTKKSNNNQSISKKSIVNSTRPKSFAESFISDDESTLGSSSQSECDLAIDSSKAVVVVP